MNFQEWQDLYPTAFKNHPYINTLSSECKRSISKKLTQITNKGFFSEANLEAILQVYTKNHAEDEIDSLLNALINYSGVTSDVINILCTSNYPLACIQLFLKTTPIDLNTFLLKVVNDPEVLSGLEDALFIYDCAARDIDLSEFILMAKLLANPLCKAVLVSAKRTFSDYAQPNEFDQTFVNDLINKISALNSEKITSTSFEKQVEIFFDALVELKQPPCSQKFMYQIYADVDISELPYFNKDELREINRQISAGINIEKIIITKLKEYIKNKTNDITCLSAKKKLIRELHDYIDHGLSNDLLADIIYDVAATIELEDFYSTRTYTTLMQEITQTASNISLNHEDFSEELNLIPEIVKNTDFFASSTSQVTKKSRISEIFVPDKKSLN